ncbi:S41 family peptidase [Ferdinandcohnia sp. Marseille-Q9671]
MRNWYLRIGLLLTLILLTVMIVGPNLPLVDEELTPERLRFFEGGGFEKAPFPPSSQDPLGTDADGIDILSVLIHGLDDTVETILLITTFTFLIAIPLAFLASNQRGLADWIIQALSYLFSSIPPILAVVLLVSTPYVEQSPARKELMIIVIAIVGVGRIGVLFQQQIIQLAQKEYMHAGLIQGNNPFQMYVRHYLPNLWAGFVSNFFLEASRVTLLIGQLGLFSYFFNQKLVIKDVGDYEWQSTDFDWLSFLASGRTEILHAFWIPLFPALAITILMITFQYIGEGLRIQFHTKSAKQENRLFRSLQLFIEGVWFDRFRTPLIKFVKNPMVVSLVCLAILISSSLTNPGKITPVYTAASGTNGWIDKERQLENVTAFANLYGYVRFFHPSDEVTEIDWNQLALYGMGKIIDSKNDSELKEALEELFLPLAPTVKLYFTDEKIEPYVPDYDRLQNPAYEMVFWQHTGLKIKENLSFLPLLTEAEQQDKMLIPSLSTVYKSNRVYYSYARGAVSIRARSQFDQFPKETDVIEEPLNKGLKVQLPIALPAYQGSTKFGGENKEFRVLQNQLKKIDVFSADTTDENVQLTNAVILWNIVKYFYPHFDIVDVDMNQQLTYAVTELLHPTHFGNYEDFKIVLEKMLTPLQDGHFSIRDKQSHVGRYLPFWADIFDGEVVVTAVSEDSPFKIGDVILERSGESAIDYINQLAKRQSGTKQFKEFNSLKRFVRDLNGRGEEVFTILRDGKEIEVKAAYSLPKMVDRFNRPGSVGYKHIGNDIYYLNIDYLDEDQVETALEELQDAKGIIFDLRGYPGSGLSEILHRLSDDVMYDMYINVPQVVKPNQLPSFEVNQYKFLPKQGTLESRNVALIDASCISACENYAEVFKGNQLATIIGEPTAGTNGAINLIKLPGNMGAWFTGMQALNVDGSQHHTIGVHPHIKVERTREAAIEGRDELLEFAIEYLVGSRGQVP